MKKIVVISGSPRPNGNTTKITRIFQEKLQQQGLIDFKVIFLKKENLQFCRGCLACMKKGEEFCPNKDNALLIRDELRTADGVIFISPVYVHTVSALMKNFYDRFAYFCHQPQFMGKPAMLIVTTELSGAEDTLDYMHFPAFTWGFEIIDHLGVVYPSFQASLPYRQTILQKIDQAAIRFLQVLTHGNPQPSFKQMVLFNLMKTKVTMHRDVLKHDYQFWKTRGWLDKDFYVDVQDCSLKLKLARWVVHFRVKKMMKTLGIRPQVEFNEAVTIESDALKV